VSDKIATKPGSDTRWNQILYGFWRQLIGTSLRIYTRGTIEGQGNLPEGAFVLTPVHRSYIDLHVGAGPSHAISR
jgi:1-acyl-sn-glycerol-3-phosphate acyltransferase